MIIEELTIFWGCVALGTLGIFHDVGLKKKFSRARVVINLLRWAIGVTTNWEKLFSGAWHAWGYQCTVSDSNLQQNPDWRFAEDLEGQFFRVRSLKGIGHWISDYCKSPTHDKHGLPRLLSNPCRSMKPKLNQKSPPTSWFGGGLSFTAVFWHRLLHGTTYPNLIKSIEHWLVGSQTQTNRLHLPLNNLNLGALHA